MLLALAAGIVGYLVWSPAETDEPDPPRSWVGQIPSQDKSPPSPPPPATRRTGDDRYYIDPSAWWATAEFRPQHLRVAGVHIGRISRDWELASPLTAFDLPEATTPGEGPEDHRVQYDVIFDIDQDGSLERAVVGVYRTRAKELGSFLVIFPANTTPDSKPLGLYIDSGEARFSGLVIRDTVLSWVSCLHCGIFLDISLKPLT